MRSFPLPGALSKATPGTVSDIIREMDATSAYIIKREAPALTEPFLTRLPREIRDLVYEYVCVFPDTIQIALSGQQGAPVDPVVIWSDAQLMDASYLANSEVVPTELSETYWSKNRFEVTVGLDTGMRAGGLDTFLLHGTVPSDKLFWRVFVRPWEKIRHLKVHVACEQWESDPRYGDTKMKDYYTTAYGLIDDLTFAQAAMYKLEAQLTPLTRMRGREELHIEIEIDTRFAQEGPDVQFSERHFVNIMESLRRTVCELLDSGVHVTVTLANIDYNEAHLEPQTWDITSRFVVDAQERLSEQTQIDTYNRETGYFVQPQAALYHCVSRAALADMEGFRQLLLRRWKVRYALPWIVDE
ncbi:hypothetical protein BKA58DRAFT_195518 [Alternaria rosae]|uniref:uncharacterized protein n=1 Tax=Alternaria rosae TaxID=1187941 RepID=UPI001E8DC539|nr:uncharacterized protein BKA58DRAFT_195518 [Alternaria rosae]KAH6868468.1 hypothetical protein BKA58DRAFT_195518 [Alternaria rosae]